MKEFADRWAKVKPISTYARNFELVWDKIKYINIENIDETRKWTFHASCRRNFTNE